MLRRLLETTYAGQQQKRDSIDKSLEIQLHLVEVRATMPS